MSEWGGGEWLGCDGVKMNVSSPMLAICEICMIFHGSCPFFPCPSPVKARHLCYLLLMAAGYIRMVLVFFEALEIMQGIVHVRDLFFVHSHVY